MHALSLRLPFLPFKFFLTAGHDVAGGRNCGTQARSDAVGGVGEGRCALVLSVITWQSFSELILNRQL